MRWSSWYRPTRPLATARTCRRPVATSSASTRALLGSARSVPPNLRAHDARMIGLFGGSFDPVHYGHLIVGQVAREVLGLDVLRFLPAREQPFKQGRHHGSPAEIGRASCRERVWIWVVAG